MVRIGFTEDFVKDNSDLIEELITRLLKAPTPLDSFNRQYLAVHGYSTAERLKKINTPTLVIHGKEDVFVPSQNAEILVELISGAKLIFFENRAHAFFIEEPEKFAKTLLEFLK